MSAVKVTVRRIFLAEGSGPTMSSWPVPVPLRFFVTRRIAGARVVAAAGWVLITFPVALRAFVVIPFLVVRGDAAVVVQAVKATTGSAVGVVSVSGGGGLKGKGEGRWSLQKWLV